LTNNETKRKFHTSFFGEEHLQLKAMTVDVKRNRT